MNSGNTDFTFPFLALHNFKSNYMDWADAFGYFGSFLSSVTFFPQVVKTWKTRSAGDLSMMMLLIVLLSTIVWLVYAFAKGLMPVIYCNGIVCILSIFLIYFKLTFKS